MRVSQAAGTALSRAVSFVRRQPRDWIVSASRSSIHRFFYQMVLPYLSIYAKVLGASVTQIGLINSIGMGAAGICGPFTGWLIDKIGAKKVYLFGIIFLALFFLIYGIAQNWLIIILGMLAYWVGFASSGQSCGVICASSIAPEDRATAMSLCETMAMGLMGMAAPMVGASLVAAFGGITASGIRPLFFIGLAGTIATFFLILAKLSSRNWGRKRQENTNFLKDISQVFREGRYLKRFLVISSLTYVPQGMIIPFVQVFAREVKGANEFILGAMVTAAALTPLLLGIPMGRLADRIGRKKVIFLVSPLFLLSNLMLIWAPNSGFLIASGVLKGFYFIGSVVTTAMSYELVPKQHMGRWIGMIRLVRMPIAAVAAFLAGAIWDNIGPQYLFLGYIGLELLIRIPLLLSMPETLKRSPVSDNA
ncbi:MAG: MFS transporter [Chloroflexota bacterium]